MPLLVLPINMKHYIGYRKRKFIHNCHTHSFVVYSLALFRAVYIFDRLASLSTSRSTGQTCFNYNAVTGMHPTLLHILKHTALSFKTEQDIMTSFLCIMITHHVNNWLQSPMITWSAVTEQIQMPISNLNVYDKGTYVIMSIRVLSFPFRL